GSEIIIGEDNVCKKNFGNRSFFKNSNSYIFIFQMAESELKNEKETLNKGMIILCYVRLVFFLQYFFVFFLETDKKDEEQEEEKQKERKDEDGEELKILKEITKLSVKDLYVRMHHDSNRPKNGYKLGDCKIFEHLKQKKKQHNLSLDRYVGCMIGMPIGDAIGHPFEFIPVTLAASNSRPIFNRNSDDPWQNEVNRFRLERGQWTDDASMGLCMADSLIVYQYFNGSDLRTRFWNWWFNGYNNAFQGKKGSVGLGGNIGESIYSLELGEIPSERYEVEHNREDSGNGSLMRLAAIPIFFSQTRTIQSFTTHPGYIAAECCSFMSFIIIRSIHRDESNININNIQDWLNHLCQEYKTNLESDIAVLVKQIETQTSAETSDKTKSNHEDKVHSHDKSIDETESKPRDATSQSKSDVDRDRMLNAKKL
ncbi:hypothetical protein RFI_30117, partial [Reticulomyxa filosa]